LPEGQSPDTLVVAKESSALQLIFLLVDNQQRVKAIIDPGSQIIAMAEDVGMDLALIYAVSYTPPWVAVESMWTPCGLHKVLVDSLWTPCRLHKVLVDSLWTPCGLLVDSLWTPHGLHLKAILAGEDLQ
jgi:hypothetical protein